jgi:hypothetical protein
MIWFVAAVWTLAPLYYRNFAQFRARLWVWIYAPVPWASGLAITALEWLVKRLLEFSAVQKTVEVSGISQEYYEQVLPFGVVFIVTTYLSVRYLIYIGRLGGQKSEQIEAQCQGRNGPHQDEQRLFSGALSKEKGAPDQTLDQRVHSPPSDHHQTPSLPV